jgi:uncharacterized membrane protein HdeD (DUF308 family)
MNPKTPPARNILMVTGIVLVVLGLLVLVSPVAAGSIVIKVVALVLAITGILQLLSALRSAGRTQRVVSMVLGAIVAGVGVLVWFNTELGSGLLTTLLMIFFVVNGLWKLSSALRFRPAAGWAWLLLSGLLSLLFVYLLWRQLPLAGAWAIGVLVGLDLLLTGVALILLARALRRAGATDRLDTINL